MLISRDGSEFPGSNWEPACHTVLARKHGLRWCQISHLLQIICAQGRNGVRRRKWFCIDSLPVNGTEDGNAVLLEVIMFSTTLKRGCLILGFFNASCGHSPLQTCCAVGKLLEYMAGCPPALLPASSTSVIITLCHYIARFCPGLQSS